MVRAAPAPFPERSFLLGRLSNAGLTMPCPPRARGRRPKPFTKGDVQQRRPGHTCSVGPLSRQSGSEEAMDIGEWLRNLGLGQYESAFRDNEIDGEVLPNLTADDLKELGVAIVGHRRKLLTAIAELLASAAAPAPVAPPAVASPVSAQAERRPITVMFCDLVG